MRYRCSRCSENENFNRKFNNDDLAQQPRPRGTSPWEGGLFGGADGFYPASGGFTDDSQPNRIRVGKRQ